MLRTLNCWLHFQDFQQFKTVISGNAPLITKVMRNDLVIPEFERFCETVTELFQKLKNNMGGHVRMSTYDFLEIHPF